MAMWIAMALSLAFAKPLYLKTAPAKSISDTHLSTSSASLFVLQFDHKNHGKLKTELQDAGVQFLRYIPDDAFIIRTNSPLSQRSAYRLFPYSAEMKISPKLPRPEKSKGTRVRVQVTVFEPGEVPHCPYTERRHFTCEIDLSDLLELAADDRVEFIGLARKMRTQDLSAASQLKSSQLMNLSPTNSAILSGYENGMHLANFDSAWSRGYDGSGQVIGFADSGLDRGDMTDMPLELNGAILSGSAFGLHSRSWSDPSGHGTHVAGLLAMRGVLTDGKIRGGAHSASLVVQGLWSQVVGNVFLPADLKTLFRDAYDKGARIHNNSWGSVSSPGIYDGWAVQADEFMWSHPDMLLVFSAGNGGEDANGDGRVDQGGISAPGTAKNVLTVGASESAVNIGFQKTAGELDSKKWPMPPLRDDTFSNNSNGLAVFSGRGPTEDGRIKPDIVAPGTNILSLQSRLSQVTPMWGSYSEDLSFSGGTSVSAPIASSAATLIRQKLVQEGLKPSAALVKGLLMIGAHDLFPGQFGTGTFQEIPERAPGPNQGFGRLDLKGSLNAQVLVDNRVGLVQGETITYEFETTEPQTLRVLMTYTDFPAAPAASKSLVSDLDMIVSLEGGQVLSSLGGVDNWEYLEFFAPVGKHSVTVKAFRIPLMKGETQPFALVLRHMGNQ